MHSNRVVEYKGTKKQLREIKKLQPKGRQMSRTITVIWKGLSLYITAVKRIDKHGVKTIVFQAATYKATPNNHAKNYKRRWGIEKLFRTTKQSLGLQECFSTKIGTQYNHICAVLLAYAITQLEMKKNHLKNAEEAIRRFKKQNSRYINWSNATLDQNFRVAYA